MPVYFYSCIARCNCKELYYIFPNWTHEVDVKMALVIQKYHIVSSAGIMVLQELVNDFIDKGWEPFGSPFDYEGRICQALVFKGVA